jgi:replicative DNA helicase
MYFSLEMAFNLLASCFDSRIASIDSRGIIFGKLNIDDKKKYKMALKGQVEEKLNIWIVDVALNASSSVILEEAEIYTATTGKKPDLIVVDYANIMMPVNTHFYNSSERYKNLFEEYHQIAKYLNAHILTFTQETRERTKEDMDRKKRDDTEGTVNIGLSNYIAPSCETVIRIKQDANDRLQSIVWFIIDKNRYGVLGVKVPVTARWATTYVGDRVRADTMVFKNPARS